MTEKLPDADKDTLLMLANKLDQAKNIFCKLAWALDTRETHDKFIRALILMAVGYIATATAIASSVIVGLVSSNSAQLMRSIGGDLLSRNAWVIGTSMLGILLLQGVRLFLKLKLVEQRGASVLSIFVISIPTLVVLWTAEIAVCGGAAVTLPETSTVTGGKSQDSRNSGTVSTIDGRLLSSVFLYNCDAEVRRWFRR